uniref:RRM domain-containing protein n=1 Tax=Strigamia maritima TaxID=126957 RepID=T1IQB9_STRMM
MNTTMQLCTDTSESQVLFEAQGLYLKPMAKTSISVQLPQLKMPGKSISNWEVMEKIKAGIKPNQFTTLKVSKSTLEFIRFEGEAENRTQLKNINSRLDNRTIKLSGFPDSLRVRAAETKVNFPTRQDWDSFFRDVKSGNDETRPDTIHFQQLPCRWFANKVDLMQDRPDEDVLKGVFTTFGSIKCIDIPMLDPYRREMTRSASGIQTFSFGQDLTFEAFVQFQEYIGFVKAMDAFKGMKLMHKNEDGKCFTANVKIDFDRTNHLGEKNVRKRRLEREKLIQLEKEREDRVRKEREAEGKRKEDERMRQENEDKERELKREIKLQKREERRRRKEEKKKRLEKEKKLALKLSMEERIKVENERKIVAERLLGVLFNKIKIKKQKEEIRYRMALEREKLLKKRDEKIEQLKHEELAAEKREKNQLVKQEHVLREKILQNLQLKREEEQRERLRHELSGRTKLKSVLVAAKNETIPKLKSQT